MGCNDCVCYTFLFNGKFMNLGHMYLWPGLQNGRGAMTCFTTMFFLAEQPFSMNTYVTRPLLIPMLSLLYIIWFYVEAACRPSPSARLNSVNYITQNTGIIVLKFGLKWLTFQGRRSKVKITASQRVFHISLIFISDHIFVLYQVEGTHEYTLVTHSCVLPFVHHIFRFLRIC